MPSIVNASQLREINMWKKWFASNSKISSIESCALISDVLICEKIYSRNLWNRALKFCFHIFKVYLLKIAPNWNFKNQFNRFLSFNWTTWDIYWYTWINIYCCTFCYLSYVFASFFLPFLSFFFFSLIFPLLPFYSSTNLQGTYYAYLFSLALS